MCLDCGCHMPTNSHGDGRHIVLSELVDAATASGILPDQALANMLDTYHDVQVSDPGRQFAAALALPVLIVDIDDTIAFSSESAMTAINAAFDTGYKASDVAGAQWDMILDRTQRQWLSVQMSKSDIYENIAPNYHAIDVIGFAKRIGYHVHITSARDPSLTPVTNDWLDRWNVPRDGLALVGRGRKIDWVRGRYGPDNPAVLIDDKPQQWLAAGPGISVWTPHLPKTPSHPPPGVWIFDDWELVRAALVNQA